MVVQEIALVKNHDPLKESDRGALVTKVTSRAKCCQLMLSVTSSPKVESALPPDGHFGNSHREPVYETDRHDSVV